MLKVMVVAGGQWQCPILKRIKDMGHYVICSNLYEDSPGFVFADATAIANVLDREKNLEIAKQYMPDAILTDQSDIAVPTVAYVAEQLGIRGITSEKAKLFTNKYLMRDFTAKAGFASPGYRLCHTAEEAKDFLKTYGRSIIKPLDSQSSKGVHIIDTPEQIDDSFEDALQYSNGEKAVVIEEYIEGTEFTVDGLKTDDAYYVTAISQKEHFAFNKSIASKLLFSNTNEQFDYDKLRKVNTEMVKVMGLPFGLTHAEYKYRNGEFYLIEIAARGGGTKISSDIVPLVSGIQTNEILVNTLLGQKPEVKVGVKHEYAVLGFFDFKPGKVVSIEGMDEAWKIEGVHDLGLEVRVGDVLAQANDDRSRCGYYILYADSREELLEREKKLKNTLKVITVS